MPAAISSQSPSSSPKISSAESIMSQLNRESEVFYLQQQNAERISEKLFEHLFEVPDHQLYSGNIPKHQDEEISAYVQDLNLLFPLSKMFAGNVIVLDRKAVQSFSPKIFTSCMCHDGGVHLDVLCDIVNAENAERIPNAKTKVTKVVQPFATNDKSRSN